MSFENENQKISYALGLSVGGSLKQSGVETIDTAQFTEAIEAIFGNKDTKLAPQEANALLKNYFDEIHAKAAEILTKVGKEFLAKNKLNEEVVELPSGLQYKVLNSGSGDKPKATDKVKCHYHGTLINGEVFDSSVQRGEPAVFPVNGVIQGWVEALQLMPVGAKWQLFIPSNLAYGAQGAGGSIGPHETLIFEVELLEIVS